MKSRKSMPFFSTLLGVLMTLTQVSTLVAQEVVVADPAQHGLLSWFPLNPAKAFSKTEILYLSSEIQLSEDKALASISLYQQGIGKLENIRVYVKNTNETALWNGTWDLTGYTQVFEGTIENEPHREKLTIPLGRSFTYDHTQNLQVAIEQLDHELLTYPTSNLYHPRYYVTKAVYPAKCRWISDAYERTDLYYYTDNVYPYPYTYSRPEMAFEFEDELSEYSPAIPVTITLDEGWLFDQGGATGGYNHNQDYTYILRPQNPGERLILDFIQFDLEASTDCDADYLEVYNGEDTNAPLLGRFCGGEVPGQVFSANASGALTFKFHSNGSVAGNGWSARVSTTKEALLVDAGSVPEVCSECVVTLGSNNSVAFGTPPYTFEWSPAIGLDNPTAERPHASPEMTTTYTLKVTDANGLYGTDEIVVKKGHKCHEVQIGTLDDYTCGHTMYSCEHPINRKHSYNRQEVLYKQEEIGYAGRLRTLRFYKVFEDQNIPIKNLEIYMKHTEDETLGNANELDLTGYTKVFEGELSNAESCCEWVDIELDEAFFYNNEDNLQIAVKQGWQEPLQVCVANAWPCWAVSLTGCGSMMRACFGDDSNEGPLLAQQPHCGPIRPDAQLLLEDDEPTYYTRRDTMFVAHHGRFYDSGGPKNPYTDEECYEVTFYPTEEGKALCFEFVFWEVLHSEDCLEDVLEVYDGPSSDFPLLGRYCGDNSPGNIHSSHPSGALTFVYYSNEADVAAGWEAIIRMEDNDLRVDAGEDRSICSACVTVLGGNPVARGGDENYTYAWSPATGLDATDVEHPVANPQVSTLYTVTVTDGEGTVGTDEVYVEVVYPGNEVTVGDAPDPWPSYTPLGSGCYPVNRQYQHSQVEMLYTAAEIQQGGLIRSLGFFKLYADQNIPLENIEIYIKHTPETQLANAYGVDYTGYQKVFGSGTVQNTEAGAQWIMIDLETPFMYNGTDNLLISFKAGPQSVVSNVYDAPYWSQTYTSYPMVRSRFQNYDELGWLYAPAVNDPYQKFRPDVLFAFDDITSTSLFSDEDVVFEITAGTFYSSGGPQGTSGQHESYEVAFHPEDEDAFVSIDFSSFSSTVSCDEAYMEIYDGPDENAPLVGRFCGTAVPDEITSTHETGALFIKVRIETTSSPALDWVGDVRTNSTPLTADAGGVRYACDGCLVRLGGDPVVKGGASRSYTYNWSPSTDLDDAGKARPTLQVKGSANQTFTLTVGDGTSSVSDQLTVVIDDPEKDIEIGSSSTSGTTAYPTNNSVDLVSTELLYLKEEINFGGTITTLSFYDNTLPPQSQLIEGVSIYMKNTKNNALESGETASGYTRVFKGDVLKSGTGWMTIILDKPFVYQSNQNLQIGIVHQQNETTAYQPQWKTSLTPDVFLAKTYAGAQTSNPVLTGTHQRTAIRLHFNNTGHQSFEGLQYATLQRQLTGSTFYTSSDAKLRFKYEEKYSVADDALLHYRIYDGDQNVLVNLPFRRVHYGINYFEIPLRNLRSSTNNFKAGNIYMLEVEGPKGDVWYLKFYYKFGNEGLLPREPIGPRPEDVELPPVGSAE